VTTKSSGKRDRNGSRRHTSLFLVHRQRLPVLFLNLLELCLYRRLVGLGQHFPLGFDVAQWDERGGARARARRRGGRGRGETAESETLGRARDTESLHGGTKGELNTVERADSRKRKTQVSCEKSVGIGPNRVDERASLLASQSVQMCARNNSTEIT
jgi:hypothetical protein